MRNALVVTIALLTVAFNGVAQNMVPNPGFEEYDQCPTDFDQLGSAAKHWYSASLNTPDYYNACTSNPELSVPVNYDGYQPARSGNAYAGIAIYGDSVGPNDYANLREYAAVRLTEPLQADTPYCASFFLSLCGIYHGCAVANVGIFFSSDSIHCLCADTLGVVPQIAHDPTVLLQDSIGWMEVSGTFVAQGGERFIAIGNFLPNATTNVLLTVPPFNLAYYYLDDVSVMKCSQVGLSVNAVATDRLQLYPNPASSRLTVAFPFHRKSTLQLTDALGRVVLSLALEAGSHQGVLDVSSMPNGIYTVEIIDETLGAARSKVVVLH